MILKPIAFLNNGVFNIGVINRKFLSSIIFGNERVHDLSKTKLSFPPKHAFYNIQMFKLTDTFEKIATCTVSFTIFSMSGQFLMIYFRIRSRHSSQFREQLASGRWSMWSSARKSSILPRSWSSPSFLRFSLWNYHQMRPGAFPLDSTFSFWIVETMPKLFNSWEISVQNRIRKRKYRTNPNSEYWHISDIEPNDIETVDIEISIIRNSRDCFSNQNKRD